MTAALPPRIARLPQDARGYPIPWNVLRGVDGAPIFTVNDDEKHLRALYENLCPICGEKLGRWKWFVGGPRSAFSEHGWYFDLPGHHECETFALAACPYLAMPRYLKRIDIPDPSKLPRDMVTVLLDETQIADRPEIFVTIASDRIEVQEREYPLTPYVRPARPPLGYQFWRHGQRLMMSEALPFLRAALGADWMPPAVRE
jgi:hypothetical protein